MLKPRVISRLLAVIVLLVSGSVAAHPHVWIRFSARVHMQGKSIVSITQTWRFTEGFPVQLVGVDTLPDNGPLNAKQTALFRDQAFSSLAGAHYFSHVFADGQLLEFRDPADFRVSVDHGKLVYSFTLPLKKPVDVTAHQVSLGIWDESFFVDYEPDGTNAVTIDGQAASTCIAKPFVDHAHPIFNGIVVPQAAAITC